MGVLFDLLFFSICNAFRTRRDAAGTHAGILIVCRGIKHPHRTLLLYLFVIRAGRWGFFRLLWCKAGHPGRNRHASGRLSIIWAWFSLSAEFGRLLQGAGGAFAFTGAVYLASHGFSGKYLATAIGVTQCFGMLGGSAGQFLVAPLIHETMNWQQFWIDAGIVCLIVAVMMFFVTPKAEAVASKEKGSLRDMFSPYKVVLSNPQSYLCGFSAGLLFLPTTIGDMIWGVPFIREAAHLDFSEAVKQVSMVPLGWVVGCPLLGYLTDVIGRRKPVLIGGAVFMLIISLAILYVPQAMLPPYLPGLLLGFGSGAAMIPYTIIKEVN